ncbi:DUF3592 domain-containing protein [Paucibacter sp. DJ1R-11]|uniref:DUF3592 domain-containing protein n=1 Tax=Paucibacter sp. DJ1R-11 TaxID=2893556 RepID=UPI00398C2775
MALQASSLTAAWIRAVFLVLFSIPFISFSAFLTERTFGEIEGANETVNWPSVPGHIAFSDYISPDGGGKSRAQVRYTFVAGGVTYQGQRVQYGSSWSHSSILRDFPVGPTRVYYSPDQPTLSVLRPGLASGTILSLAVSLVFGVVPMGYLLCKAVGQVRNAL